MLMGLNEAGCCHALPEFQIHQLFSWFVVVFVYTRFRRSNHFARIIYRAYPGAIVTFMHVLASLSCARSWPNLLRLSAIRQEHTSEVPVSNGPIRRRNFLQLVLHICKRFGPIRACAYIVCSFMWATSRGDLPYSDSFYNPFVRALILWWLS